MDVMESTRCCTQHKSPGRVFEFGDTHHENGESNKGEWRTQKMLKPTLDKASLSVQVKPCIVWCHYFLPYKLRRSRSCGCVDC